jgi:uncharacterized FlaG/YvyC family protein
MAMNTGSITSLMQGVVRQLRPEMSGAAMPFTGMPQGAGQESTVTRQGAGALSLSGGNRGAAVEPAVTPWPKMQIDPQQEMIRLRESLGQWVQSILSSTAREFNFSKDEMTGTLVTRVVNPSNGQLVRQIPPDISLKVQYWLQEVYGHDPTRPRGWSFNDWA